MSQCLCLIRCCIFLRAEVLRPFGRLRDTVRSSLYNLSPRSPQSMKRRFSSQGNTPSHSRNPSRSISSPQSLSEDSPSIPLRRRKEPPPPLDLSSLSAFHTKVQIKTAQRKFVSKSSKRKGEQDQHGGDSAHRRELSDFNDSHMARPKISRRITLKGILRSVRSISSMRSAQ